MSDQRRAVLVLPDTEIAAAVQDAVRARDDLVVVAVLANGVGWFAALAVAGVLTADDAALILGELASAATDAAAEQVVYPLTDAAWRPDPRLRAGLDAATAAADGGMHLAIDLGAYAVLAGVPSAAESLAAELPPVTVGQRSFPLRVAGRPPVHTPLAAPLVERLLSHVADVSFRRPELTLIDGRGVRHTPWSADPAALREQALGEGLLTTWNLATAMRVALREHAPDLIVIPGHGGILPAVCSQLVVAEGYRGIRSRSDFIAAQGQRPLVLSMRH